MGRSQVGDFLECLERQEVELERKQDTIINQDCEINRLQELLEKAYVQAGEMMKFEEWLKLLEDE